MTDKDYKDYIAISNTGKNITVSMTHGMKQTILGSHDCVRLRVAPSNHMLAVAFVPCAPGRGYKIFRRKNVWNMSMASKRLNGWPRHERIVVSPSQVDMTEHGAFFVLPKPAAPAPDAPTPRRDEPAMVYQHIKLAGEPFGVKVRKEDDDRFFDAYLRTLEKTEARFLFKTPDMVVAAITGACFGFLVALAISAAGVLS